MIVFLTAIGESSQILEFIDGPDVLRELLRPREHGTLIEFLKYDPEQDIAVSFLINSRSINYVSFPHSEEDYHNYKVWLSTDRRLQKENAIRAQQEYIEKQSYESKAHL